MKAAHFGIAVCWQMCQGIGEATRFSNSISGSLNMLAVCSQFIKSWRLITSPIFTISWSQVVQNVQQE